MVFTQAPAPSNWPYRSEDSERGRYIGTAKENTGTVNENLRIECSHRRSCHWHRSTQEVEVKKEHKI